MRSTRLFVWLPGVLALLVALAALLPAPKARGMDLAAFGRLPVLEEGRVKPIDTVARNALLLLRGQQSLRTGGRKIGPDEWLLDVLFRPGVAGIHPCFVINDPDVLGLLDLPASSGRYVSFAALAPRLGEIQRQAFAASELEPAGRTRYQRAILELYQRVVLYHRLANTLQSERSLMEELQTRGESGAALRHQALAELAAFRPLLPAPGQSADAWQTVGEGLAAATPHPALEMLGRAGAAYAAGDAQAFNTAAAALERLAASAAPRMEARARAEFLFNRMDPFYQGMVIYLLALVVLFLSWAWKPQALGPAAFSLLAAGLAIHTAGLAFRVLLQGRPPVTNLYSSAVFVGWVAALLGALLERAYRRGFGTAVACAAGFASLIVAHHLSGNGDTMEMMRAVLDSNFWLTTHVVTITIGYGGTFLAGALAIAWTLREHLAAHLDEATGQALLDTTYGILCFSLLFTFVGTVLGGIWAEQAWGRFWGWDPKENGALLVLLWNALILHARLGGQVQARGFMAMAIGGNVVTGLAWFGVNMLGIGLHAYGFTEKGPAALGGFVATQLVLAGLSLLPRRRASD